ncbi:MAG TPA: archease [Acidobacteriota bacterium]|nr:archease [Acidobacteriota bacterium]
MGSYEFFDHVADVGIRVRADSIEDLFVTAALGLTAWIGPPPEGGTREDRMWIEAEYPEELLVRWLQEILCHFHLQHAYVTGVKELHLDVERCTLEALLLSRTWEDAMRGEYQEVKAVTYHQLKIEQRGGAWLAAVILDI